jgi:hypothetical protein
LTFLASKLRPWARILQAIRASLGGERDRQQVVVLPLFGRLDPGFEPVAFPSWAFICSLPALN